MHQLLCIINRQNVVIKQHISAWREYASNWSEEVFVVNKIKNTVPWTYVTNDLNGEEIIGKIILKFNETVPSDLT